MDIQHESENDEGYCRGHQGLRQVSVIFSPEAEEVCRILARSNSKADKSILKSVIRKTELIKVNPHYGEPIAKRLFPEEYVIKYSVTNLFWVELSNFWRMIYTLTNNDIEIIAFVIDISDHKKYNKKFGYH
jgi:hypothetical protein